MDTTAEAKVVLITGSSSGIGAETARLFAKRQFKVAITGSNRERVEQVANECTQLSPSKFQALAIVADLSDLDNAERLVKQTVDHFGRLDVLVNNVGVHHKTNAADKSSFRLYQNTFAINVDSVIKTTMEAVPHLEKSGGNIVFVSSTASVKPAANAYAYRMSKAALSSYAKCLAIDIAPKVRVNIVSPGPVATPLFDKAGISRESLQAKARATNLLGRPGEVEEIASAIYYLASDEASYFCGAELFVDGGSLCKPIQ
uniref:Putative oxidoreductase yhdF n=1 Tax=Aceria tosichella TaxID=561515 RepID=A0A6G1S5G9_9ACAR